MFSFIMNGLGALVSPIAGIFQKREERKTAKASAQGKLALAKQTGQTDITLTDAEWESINASGLANSWKDEYVTVIITCPIPLILFGSIYAAFTGDNRVIDGTIEGIHALASLGMDFEFVLSAVVLAAIGLKMWRAK